MKTPDIWIIAVDETALWDLSGLDPSDLRGGLQGIFGIYFFDRNQVTHAAEMTGSYWLRHIEDQPRYVTPDSLTNAERDRIDEYIWEGSNQADDGSHYRHVHEVEAFLAAWKNKKGSYRVRHYGSPLIAGHGGPKIKWADVEGNTPEEKYDNVMEAVRQGLQEDGSL